MEQNLYGQMETENKVKKETTTSIEHSDFEDIFTGYGNTDSVQKIVSDYNSDEDVESETDYHNIAMKTTCFDIHEQQLEIIRQDASGMIFSQNLLSDVPERHVFSGFLSVHNFICDSSKNTELDDKAEIFKHGIPQFREARSKQLFHESEDNKYTSDCCHGQHKIVETDKRQHARTYVVKDCCRRAPRNTRQENKISPNCPYMNGQEIENVPIHEEDRLQPRHHIEQTLVPSTAPVNQARVAAEAEAVRIPVCGRSPPNTSRLPKRKKGKTGLNSIEISIILVSGSAGQGRLLGTSQSGDFSFRFPSTQSGLNSIEISIILVSGSAGQGRLLGTSQSGDFSFRFPSTQSGFGRFYWILLFLGFLVLSISCATSQSNGTKVDWQSDSLVHVFGESLNLICKVNNSIANKTDAWYKWIGESKREPIYFGTTLNNPAKFETIDGGSTLEMKNLTEDDITDYCYYCSINDIYSECKNIFDQKNHVVLPSRTAVTFPMNKTIRLQSGCYPNLTFSMIIQKKVVATQTATKKDNGLYEVDMIFNYTLKNGEPFVVVARDGNKSYIVYNSTDDQIIKQDSSGINIGLIVGVVVGILVVVVISIVLVVYIINKRRRLRRDRNRRLRRDTSDTHVQQADETGAQNEVSLPLVPDYSITPSARTPSTQDNVLQNERNISMDSFDKEPNGCLE